MKRQIIKTRPVQPYRIARIVIALVVVALLAVLAYVIVRPRVQPAHASVLRETIAWQDLANASMKSRSPAILT